MNAVKVLELLGVYLYDLMAKRADEVRKNARGRPVHGIDDHLERPDCGLSDKLGKRPNVRGRKVSDLKGTRLGAGLLEYLLLDLVEKLAGTSASVGASHYEAAVLAGPLA